MNFTEKKIYSKLHKPKLEIEKLLARGYLQRNRQIKKQPRIKPRLGMFGKSISIKITRDNPVNPLSKHIQARLNGDLGYLLEHGSNTTNGSKVTRRVSKQNVAQQERMQKKNCQSTVYNSAPFSKPQLQGEDKDLNTNDENLIHFLDANFAVQNEGNRKQSSTNCINPYGNVNQLTSDFVYNPLVSTFTRNEEGKCAKPDEVMVDLCSATSNDSRSRFDDIEFDMDTIECNIRANYGDKPPSLSELPSDLRNLNCNLLYDVRQNDNNYQTSSNPYLPDVLASLDCIQNNESNFSEFYANSVLATPLFCNSPLFTPEGTIINDYDISSFNTGPFKNQVNLPVSIGGSYFYGCPSSYTDLNSVPQLAQLFAKRTPSVLTMAMLRGAKKARERIFNDFNKVKSRLRTELIEARLRNEETDPSKLNTIISPISFSSRIENFDLVQMPNQLTRAPSNSFANMMNLSSTNGNNAFRTPNAYSDNVSIFQNTVVNEVNHNWQFNITMNNNDMLSNRDSKGSALDFFSSSDLF